MLAVVFRFIDGASYPIGVNVSKPLAADQGRPFFLTWSWRLRAVMSTASAVDFKLRLHSGTVNGERGRLRTVPSNMRECRGLWDVPSGLANDET